MGNASGGRISDGGTDPQKLYSDMRSHTDVMSFHRPHPLFRRSNDLLQEQLRDKSVHSMLPNKRVGHTTDCLDPAKRSATCAHKMRHVSWPKFR